MALKHREKLILGIGTLAAAAILSYSYLLEPFNISQVAIKKDIDKKKILIDKYGSLLSQKKEFFERSKVLLEREEELQNYLLKGDSISLAAAELQNFLHKTARTLSITIASEKVLDPIQNDIFTSIPVEIVIRSNLRKLAEFIYQTEHNDKFINISKIKMKGKKNVSPEEEELIEAKVETQGFFIREPETEQPG